LDRYPLKMTESDRYRIHKSRIRRSDPGNLNAGPDLQLYERVPIQNEVPDSRKFKVPIKKKQGTDTKQGNSRKFKVPIYKNKVPIQNEVPDSRKIKVPISKVRYRYKTRYRIQEKSRYRYGTAQRKMRY
jgi:hypothetical protein